MDKRLDTPPSAQELNSDGYRRRRIIRQFSLLEVFGYLTAAQLLAYRQWLEAAVPPQANPILIPIYLFTSPDVLLALGAGFFAMLALMLNGITPIVSVLARTSGRLVQPDFDAFQRPPDERRDQFATPKDHVVIAEYKLGTPEAPIGENGPNDLPGDALEANFISYINRSQDAARLAQRRPNALLFVGTSIAAGGLM